MTQPADVALPAFKAKSWYGHYSWLDAMVRWFRDREAEVKPGTELGYCEIRTGVNATTTSTTTPQDLGTFGMQLTIDPITRPYLLRGNAIIGHSVAGGVVGLRINEVPNGVDTPRTSADFKPVAAGTGPFYEMCKPRLRIPPSTRARTFRLQWFITTAGTGTLFTPSGGSGTPLGSTDTLPLDFQAVCL